MSEREGFENPARLHFRLRNNADYRLRFADRAQKQFFGDGALTVENSIERYLNRATQIDKAIVGESARWGDSRSAAPFTRDVHWVAERDRIVNNFFPQRYDVVLAQFEADNLFPDVSVPEYRVNGSPQNGGAVSADDAVSISANDSIWYTTDGSDPRLGESTAVSTILVSGGAAVRALVPTDDTLGSSWQQAGFDDAAWLSGTTGVGFDRGSDYQGLIGLDLLSSSIDAGDRIDTDGDGTNENNSVFTRIAFNVDDPSAFDTLSLDMVYDDGFVAYLNGEEVARSNAPASAQWDSTAPTSRGESGQVMMAISYGADNSITIYRNGVLYANASRGSLASYPAGVANVLLGLRHIDASGQAGSTLGTDPYLAGAINEARIYNTALSAAEIQQVFASGPLAGADPVPTDASLAHLWSFNENAQDQIGTANGSLFGGATIGGGRLQLDGVNDYLQTSTIDATITAKTLITWVSLDNLGQRSGSAISLQNPTGSDIFDAIVYGERTAGQWMAGSNGFTRSVVNNGGLSETRVGSQVIATETFDISSYLDRLTAGENVLAIHGLSSSATSENMLLIPTLEATTATSLGVSPTALLFDQPFSLSQSSLVKARAQRADGTWSALSEAIFTVNVDGLRISEIMYNPQDPPAGSSFTDNDFEFLELKNVGADSIGLASLAFTDGVAFDFANASTDTLAAGETVVLVANSAAFESRYGAGITIAGQYEGQLDNGGENVTLSDTFGAIVRQFEYDDNWFPQTDGEGFSLTLVDESDGSADLSARSSWRPSNRLGGSPGASDTAVTPGVVVINELLANPSGNSNGDWIELRNTSGQAVDVGGWYLSDSAIERRKFRLAADASIPAGGFLVLTEAADFGTASGNPGSQIGFGLSEHGNSVYLTAADGADNLLGYRETQSFTASLPGESLGLYTKSTGGTDFVRLIAPSVGSANEAPSVGPLVINEVMYNPAAGGAEFIELRNTSASPVTLDDGQGSRWRMRGAINIAFPLGLTIAGGGYALLVQGADGGDAATEAVAFRATFSVPASVEIVIYTGALNGSLDNGGEKLFLEMPGDPNSGLPEQPYVLIDAVKYDDAAPWPEIADGNGPSLSRFVSDGYGNDVANWTAGTIGGTPGELNMGIDTSPPTVPAGVVARIISTTEVRLVWNASEDLQSSAAEYRVYRNGLLLASTVVPLLTDTPEFSITPTTYEITSVNDDGFESQRSTPISVSAQAVTFQDGAGGYDGTRDAEIRENAPSQNNGLSDDRLEVDGDDPGGTGQGISALLRWQDLSGPAGVPAGSTIVGAAITLTVFDPGGQYNLLEVSKPWDEGAVSWNNATGAQAWDSPGARGASDVGDVIGSFSGAVGENTTVFNAAGVGLVNEWVQTPSANRGLIIAEQQGVTDGADFYSREFVTAGDRPKLTILYLTAIETPLAGDLNLDAVVDAADIDLLAAAIRAGVTDSAFDLSGDGLVDSTDQDHLVENILGTRRGDANLDSLINRTDLVLALRSFGKTENSSWIEGDFNGSGSVTLADTGLLQANLNVSSPSPQAAAAAAIVTPASDHLPAVAVDVVFGQLASRERREPSTISAARRRVRPSQHRSGPDTAQDTNVLAQNARGNSTSLRLRAHRTRTPLQEPDETSH